MSTETIRNGNGSVIHFLTLPLTEGNPAVTVRISTSELADLLLRECSEEALQSLIEVLND